MTLQSRLSGPEGLPIDATGADGPAGTTFDLPDLLRTIRARRTIIVGTAVLVVLLTAIYVFRIVPLYDATSIVMLNERENRVVDVDAVLSGLPNNAASIQNQVQILRSRSLMNRVIEKLGIDDSQPAADAPASVLSYLNPARLVALANPSAWFGSRVVILTDAQREGANRDALVDRLLGGVTVASQGASSAIQIQYRSADPSRAAIMANAIADAYVEDQLNAKFEATQTATKWLSDRLDQLALQVQTAEVAVQQYKAENNITEIAEGSTIVEQQLAQINTQLVSARSDLAEQEAKYSRLVEMERSGQGGDVSQVIASPVVAGLRAQEAELLRQEAELSARYGARHPRMVDIEAQKRNLQGKIEQEITRVVATTASDVAVSRARVNSLEDSLDQISGRTNQQNRSRIRLRELEATATSNRNLYEAFLARFKETQGTQEVQAPDARIISRAQVPVSPSYPNKGQTLMLATPAGIFLGLLLALLAERLDAGFRTTIQVERALGLPVLSTLSEIPGLAKSGKSAADRAVDKPLSSFAELIRALQLGLVLSNVDKRPKVILVTSSVPDEGKTTVAISLARMAARSGQKVILVDGDLRRPSVAEALGISDRAGGVVEAIVGEATLEQCLVKDQRSDAIVLPAVSKAPSPPDLLGSASMGRFIAGLRAAYDLVIIDSAPLLPVNDTKVLAQLVDTVVFCVRWEKTPREAVATGHRSLMDVKAPIAGVVFTRADTNRYRYYSYGYQNYYAYNKYYTD